MEKKFWLVLLILLIFPFNVLAASCSSSTYSMGYYNNGSWTTITSNPFNNIPSSATRISSKVVNSNIKTNSITLSGNIVFLASTGGLAQPYLAEARYIYSNGNVNITNNCVMSSRRVVNDNLTVTYNMSYICNYTGSQSTANSLELIINITNTNIYRVYTDNRCIQIYTDGTDKIINNDNKNTLEIQQQIYEDYLSLWDKGDEIEDVIRDESAIIQSMLTTNPNNEFVINWYKANVLENKESALKNNLLDPYNSGNLNNYIHVSSNDTEYTNAMSYMWNIIDRMIGLNSAIWVITSILLTLGLIKIVLSR